MKKRERIIKMDKILQKIKKLIPKKVFKLFQPAYHFLLNWLAAVFYGNPSDELIVIGVTGTTGKTTSSYILLKVLESAGFKAGLTSTAVFNDGEKEWMNDKKMTMLGRFFTQKMMRKMLKNGCKYAIIETTSEGVAQYRHKFINYDILVFTGLYPEHIESHGSFENYKEAKGRLFAHLGDCKTKYLDDSGNIVKNTSGIKKIDLNRIKKSVVVNGDDAHADYFLSFKAESKFVYSIRADAEKNFSNDINIIKYGGIQTSKKGLSFAIDDTVFETNLLGLFNATNCMNAISVASILGIPMEKIKNGIEEIGGILGRLERIDEGQNFVVVVDYAFEPNAVKKLYETIDLIPGGDKRKIIHVLGSTGGGRDVARRPILGELAGENAHYVIVTNEDPYDDDPELIIDQVALGAERAGRKMGRSLFKIVDRREAIERAVSLAHEGDIVLITGKGNEQAICVADGKKIKWDDRVVTREVLKGLS